ncbi:MAG: hypothetical protein V4665_01140 [Patescibacteria group bacterium]
MTAEIGNITLEHHELSELRKAVIEKYKSTTGNAIENPDKILNSNLRNYDPLYEAINKGKALKNINIRSNKPLAVLFHHSKHGVRTFRKKFINTMYRYAYGCDRGEFFSSGGQVPTPTSSILQLQKLDGYWECFYDKDGRFRENLENEGEAILGRIAFLIKWQNEIGDTVQYYHGKNWGKGTVVIKGTNFVLQLQSEVNNEPTYHVMNCGRDIDSYVGHVGFAAGLFLHISDIGNAKTGKCVMIYYPAKEIEDLNSKSFKDAFYNEFKVTKNDISGAGQSRSLIDKRYYQLKNFFLRREKYYGRQCF